MSGHHGNTPANWTAVVLSLLMFTLAGVGLIMMAWPLFWIGMIGTPVGAAIGLVMGRMGIGTGE